MLVTSACASASVQRIESTAEQDKLAGEVLGCLACKLPMASW